MSPPNPFFSIVTPVTRPELLIDALSTIYKQDFDNYEVLIHNNSGTAITLSEPYRSDDRFKLFNYAEKADIWTNWERSFLGCSGKYVMMVPDDDGLIKGSLSLANRVLEDNPVDYLRWGITGYLEKNDSYPHTACVNVPKHTCKYFEIDTTSLLNQLMSSLRVTRLKKFIPHIAMGCVRRTMLERIQAQSALCYVHGVPMESVTPDWCLAAKVLYQKPSALYLDAPLYLFRGHENSTATADMSKNRINFLDDPWLHHLGMKNAVLNRVFVSETLLAVQKEFTGNIYFETKSFLKEMLEGLSNKKDLLRAIEYSINHNIQTNFSSCLNGNFHFSVSESFSPTSETILQRLIISAKTKLRKIKNKMPIFRANYQISTADSLAKVSLIIEPTKKKPIKSSERFDNKHFEVLISR